MIAANNSLVPSGRAPGGKFAPGNTFAKGGARYVSRAAAIRRELMRCVTREDVKEITQALVREAKSGDVSAIKEFFDRLVGKAEQFHDVTAMIERAEAPDPNAFFHPLQDPAFVAWMQAAVESGYATLAQLMAHNCEPAFMQYAVEKVSTPEDIAAMRKITPLADGRVWKQGALSAPAFDPDYAEFLRRKATGEDLGVEVRFVDDWYGSKRANVAASKNNQTHN